MGTRPDYLPDPYAVVSRESMNVLTNTEPAGTDLTRRQRAQLQWAESFGREMDTLERKQRAMKIQRPRYGSHG